MLPKKTAAMILSAAILIASAAGYARAANMAAEVLRAGDISIRDDFAIVIDGVTVEPDVAPVERGGVVFIPMRFAAEALGADVTWLKNEKTAVLKFPAGTEVRMTVGVQEVDMGESVKVLPVAPFIFESRVMLPLKPTAECGLYRVEERQDAMILTSPEAADIRGYQPPGAEQKPVAGKRAHDPLKDIREKARKDQTTKLMKPYVIGAWIFAGILWIIVAAAAAIRKRGDAFKGLALILVILTAGVAMIVSFMLSSYWAAIVGIGTCIVGLVSTESYEDKLVTMASTAQGLGLICTLFGLGLLIGPAIAERDIAAIGYGIYVKIEPTITGLSLSIILNMLFGLEARKMAIKAGAGKAE